MYKNLGINNEILELSKKVEEVHPSDKQTKGILVFNEKVKQDDRVEKVILPLRDGLTMIWKK